MFDVLFDTTGFPARWNCGSAWTQAHGLTHIISDFAIFAAYAAIPFALAYFIVKRRDMPFVPIFWLFAAFIFFCGFSHFVEAFIFWHPWYRFSALIKACTAIISWVTVAALLPLIPQALKLPGLAAVNKQLQAEIEERRAADEKLRESHEEMRSFTNNMLDREDRVIELKNEVNVLLRELGRNPRYTNEGGLG